MGESYEMRASVVSRKYANKIERRFRAGATIYVVQTKYIGPSLRSG